MRTGSHHLGPWAAIVLFLGSAGCGAGGCRGASKDVRHHDAGPGPGEVRLGAGRHPAPALEGVTAIVGAGREKTRLVAAGDGPILDVRRGHSLSLSDLTLEAGEGQPAIRVGGELRIERVTLEGGSVALRIEGGTASVMEVVMTGSTTGIEVRGGRLDAQGVTLRGIGGPALFGSDGRLEARGLVAEDVDYGLLTRPEVVVAIDGFEIRDVRFAGIALVGSKARVSNVSIQGPSRHGAILANDLVSAFILEDVVLRDVGPAGLSLVRAPAEVTGLRIAGVRKTARGEEGTCVLVTAADVILRDVDLSGCEGEGVALIGGSVRIDGGRITGSGESSVEGSRGGEVTLRNVAISGSRTASVAAHEGARITVSGGSVIGRTFADCASASRVSFSTDVGGDGIAGPCVHRP